MIENTRKRSQLLTFRQGLWLVMSHGPYIKLVIGFLFTSLAFMVILSFIIGLMLKIEVMLNLFEEVPVKDIKKEITPHLLRSYCSSVQS